MIFEAFRRWIGAGANGHGGGGDGPAIPSCEEALERLYEFLDGELDDLTSEQVEAHFEVCRRCYPHLAFERAFRAALQRTVEGRQAPPELRSEVLRLLEEVAGES